MKFLVLISCAGIFFLTSCWDRNKYKVGYFPEKPVNFLALNSVYDDMNSAEPFLGGRYLFYFSSNRNTIGGTFDIVSNDIDIIWDMGDGSFSVSPANNNSYSDMDSVLLKINSSANEYGPFIFEYMVHNVSDYTNRSVIFYSSDLNGNSDIMFSYSDRNSSYFNIVANNNMQLINTEFNELYPAFYGKGLVLHGSEMYNPGNIEEIYFCADYNGNFDIYKIPFKTNMDFIDSLKMALPTKPEMLSNISSETDDKCPYINGNLLVFSSNRPGGFGGYDLYYSVRESNGWSGPVNFGETINTSADEYRPITIKISGFRNNLMFFSSNRAGGIGGYDLYYVGINPKI